MIWGLCASIIINILLGCLVVRLILDADKKIKTLEAEITRLRKLGYGRARPASPPPKVNLEFTEEDFWREVNG